MTFNRSALIATLLAAVAVFLFSGCGETDEEASINETEPSITVVADSAVSGWIEMTLSQEPPVMIEAGGNSVWLYFQGGNLLEFSRGTGKWKSYKLEVEDLVDIALLGDVPLFITESEFMVFSHEDAELAAAELPDGFTPLDLTAAGGDVAVLGDDGSLAIREEGDFTVYSCDDNLTPSGGLNRIGPDWVFMLNDGRLALFDPSVDLWQFEDAPAGEVLASSSNILFIGAEDSIFARTTPGEWIFHSNGRLYNDGLLITDNGISTVLTPGEIIAGKPAFEPHELIAMEDYEAPIWAVDDLGLTVYTDLGSVETRLPYYETQQVSCSMAGQSTGGMQGSAESVEQVMQAGGGTFRIYESVSVRPDPFSEFSTETQDARRSLESIAVEEFRLVGITLDPVGGDQAMVEDGLGVSYVLYEGTALANNSHVAEITSNEVIVIQDVVVDYSARGGGETTIPTIYSLRLHEEGGL
ncbi:MAG: hypothetical protein GF388_03850 [Candidatus Aegiribacteria sp.]|nr:hypothetical protein [Candidatus Aegiribacteria sp.]MBD3294387.1 hypothetical protein [Candidatus Fermentibacteria bacterium]